MQLPMACSRQVRNGQFRRIGDRPVRTYHTQVGPGDEVVVHIVSGGPEFSESRFKARVMGVEDHGWYLDVHYQPLNGKPVNGKLGVARLFRAGPPDWGVIEFRITRKVHRMLPPDDKRRI